MFCIRPWILFWSILKTLVKPSTRKYINKIDNITIFKITRGYYYEILTSKTKKLLQSTKNNITRDEIGQTLSDLELTQVVSTHCNIANNGCQND